MKVSVVVVTYNHARFIAQALDSVLAQETNFSYEVIISEDCSTDRTRDIVLEYQRNYPGRIRLLLSQQNLNTNYVLTRGIDHARGLYIALLDGDDYWTSPRKLQKQADFLDQHSDCAICFHDALSFNEKGAPEPKCYVPGNQKPMATLKDLLVVDFIPTAAVMFRRGLYASLPAWYDSLSVGDWPLHIINAQYGRIGYIPETMSAYRIHDGGIWTGRSRVKRLLSMIEMYEALADYLSCRYRPLIRRLLIRRYQNLAEEYERIGEVVQARTWARKFAKQELFHDRNCYKSAIGMLLRLHWPAFHKCANAMLTAFFGRANVTSGKEE
jgi:glycosyltransferase involved in cell wall biosynthesis